MSVTLAKSETLYPKQSLTHQEASEYVHKNLGYKRSSADQVLYNWTKIGALPCHLVRGQRRYVLSDLQKFSTPQNRKRIINKARWEIAREMYPQEKKELFAKALEPIEPPINKDDMLGQMKDFTQQQELPFNSVDRLINLPITERRKAFRELYMTADDIYKTYAIDGKGLALLVRHNKLDRIKYKSSKTNRMNYAYPKDQLEKVLTLRAQEKILVI